MGSTDALELARRITDVTKSSIWQPRLETRIADLAETVFELNETVNKAHSYLATRAVTTPGGLFYADPDAARDWVRAALLEFIEVSLSEQLQPYKTEGK